MSSINAVVARLHDCSTELQPCSLGVELDINYCIAVVKSSSKNETGPETPLGSRSDLTTVGSLNRLGTRFGHLGL